jgi:hypothetical protein
MHCATHLRFPSSLPSSRGLAGDLTLRELAIFTTAPPFLSPGTKFIDRMAAEDRGFRTRDDVSSVTLLRNIRSGVADFSFVHRTDVCAATPEDLVANLERRRAPISTTAATTPYGSSTAPSDSRTPKATTTGTDSDWKVPPSAICPTVAKKDQADRSTAWVGVCLSTTTSTAAAMTTSSARFTARHL